MTLFNPTKLLNLFQKPKRQESTVAGEVDSKVGQTAEQDGIFEYNNSHFSFPYFKNIKTYQWQDIKTIHASREDEIVLRILFADRVLFLVSESTPGWLKFIRLLKENIPAIPEMWVVELSRQSLTTNIKVIYDKENREDQLAIKDTFGT